MHLKMSYSEVYRMPLRYRRWFLKRLVRHFEEKNSRSKTPDEPLNKLENNSNLDMFSRFEDQIKNKIT